MNELFLIVSGKHIGHPNFSFKLFLSVGRRIGKFCTLTCPHPTYNLKHASRISEEKQFKEL